jgi:hypothetical protein
MSQITQQSVISNKDALIRLSSLIVLVAGVFQFFVGIRFIGMINQEDTTILSYIMIFIGGLALIVLSILVFATEMVSFKLNPVTYTIISLVEIVLWYFIPPSGTQAALSVQIGNSIGMFGVFFLFVALRPNFGPTANKKIYQAVAGIMAFIIAIFLMVLGIYVKFSLDIAEFAGRGTYPGDFYYAFIEVIPAQAGINAYNDIRFSGILMILTALYIMFTVMIRNKITLKIASFALLIGIIWGIVDISFFGASWDRLDNLFLNTPELAPDYYTTLQLRDPGVVTTGVILILLFGIALLMMIYASFAAKPIAQWRRRRDSSIAAAEVFFREGKLPSAVKYLERAAILSSKIDEEDKAVELLTRIKQIKDKAIKMKKAEAAEKAKKAYEKQQKEEEAAKGKKAPSVKTKQPPKSKEESEEEPAVKEKEPEPNKEMKDQMREKMEKK